MSNVVYIVEIAAALGLVILVHELGHFLAAKAFGVWVRRFAIGFGPVLLKWQRGETEYSIRALPLGGFVEPMGDHPESEGGDDPRALWRRPAWQRAVVFAAGVVLNVVLAIVFFTAAAMIGINAPSPLVGGVLPYSPAAKAGLKAGDRIVEINGDPVVSFEDVLAIVSSEDAGTVFDITVLRPAEDGGEPVLKSFKGLRSLRAPGDEAPRLGIEPAAESLIYSLLPGSPEEQAGLTTGDRIVAVNGQAVTRWRELTVLLDRAPAGPVTLEFERDGRRQELAIDPSKLTLTDLGMGPATGVGTVDADGPAFKAGVQAGDRILRIEDKPWPSTDAVAAVVKAAGDGGQVRLSVLRDGEVLALVSAVALSGEPTEARIGISMSPSLGEPVQVGSVEADGPAAAEGLEPGDILLGLGVPGEPGQPVETVEPSSWDDVMAVFGKAPAGTRVLLRVKRGEQEMSTRLTARAKPVERFAMYGSKPGPILYEPLPRLYNPVTAAGRGFARTSVWLGRVYRSILQLAKREVSTKSVGGPVLIVQASLGIAERGLGTFLNFWGILSICIAVFNFLPIPPFDGGHVLFVLLEKIKGSPIGLRVRNWVWGAGWAAVGVLFIFIMWQDIGRL